MKKMEEKNNHKKKRKKENNFTYSIELFYEKLEKKIVMKKK
jgi:hypothetical protein